MQQETGGDDVPRRPGGPLLPPLRPLSSEPFRDCNIVPDPRITSKGKTPMETDSERRARMGASSNQMTDAASQAVQKTPYRITLKMIRDAMRSCSYWNPPEVPHMTVCIIVLSNGFILKGFSTPADPGNFDAELGRKFAYEDAERSAWPLFAFTLREMISDAPCLEPLTDVKFWGAPTPPFATPEQKENAANLARADPDDE